MARRSTRALVPQAGRALEELKMRVVNEVGLAKRPGTGYGVADRRSYERLLYHFKWQIAEELGLDQRVRTMGWGEMTSRECGTVGGNLGGQVGGQMVRRMIALAEERLAAGAGLPPTPVTGVNYLGAAATRFQGPGRV